MNQLIFPGGGGPFYWDEYRLFGHGSRIGSYGYRYGNNNHRVEVNFHRPSGSIFLLNISAALSKGIILSNSNNQLKQFI
jgi:hypothetical protein